MKIYTKTGDNGTTGLFAGPRVRKDHPRIQAYGTVDELNALLGVIQAMAESQDQPYSEQENPPELGQLLREVQGDLFSMGAELATPNPQEQDMCLLTEDRAKALERWIDQADSQLSPLKTFVLPGGSSVAAQLHFARTVCRRAERDVVYLAHQPGAHDMSRLVVYLNRLSDLLFVLARLHNARQGVAELAWNRPG